MPKERTGILIILDGFGINPDPRHNAIAMAKAPTLKGLLERYPHGEIQASESHVGLPEGFMGNSEVGHLNIGAGRVVYQDFSLISHAIEEELFFENPAFLTLISKLKEGKGKGALHLMGLVSDGGVHSHISHLFALLDLAKRQGIEKVWIHFFADGRDTSPTTGVEFAEQVLDHCRSLGLGKVATVIGRFYAMDRDKRWERTEAAYQAIVGAQGKSEFSDPIAYIRGQYESNTTDEFLPPAVAKGYPGLKDGDGVIFFNFRADRARQITRALTQADFTFFRRESKPALAGFVGMTPYDESLTDVPSAYQKPKVPQTLGEVISRLGGKQLRIAETEKYAHVTYFFNGGDEKVFDGEKRVLIPSPREVRTYDQKPEMSAQQVTDSLLKELETGDYRFVVVNFANPDMVGHTGNLPAAIKAVETVDKCVGRVVQWIEDNGGFGLLTADHGNCEKMVAEDGTPFTAHTTLPVPLIVIEPQRKKLEVRPGGRLCDIAPTMLALWGIPQPVEMTGRSLVQPGK